MSWNRLHVREKVMAILRPHAQNGEQELTGKSHLVGVYLNLDDLSDKPGGAKQILKSQ